MAPASHWERLRYPSRRSTSRHHARSQPSLAAPGRRRRCLEVGVSMENAGQSTHPREFEDALMYLPRKAPTSFRKRQIVFDEHHPQGTVHFILRGRVKVTLPSTTVPKRWSIFSAPAI